MLTMRLQRIGKKGQAYFRIIVTEHTKKPQGEYLELLGSYDPHKKNLLAKKERIEHWISKGVTLSPSVNNLLVNHNIIVAPKMVSWKPKVKPESGSKNQGSEAATPVKNEAEQTSPAEEKNDSPAEETEAAPEPENTEPTPEETSPEKSTE